MDESIKELLDEEIRTEIEGLSYLNAGSEEKKAEVENLTKLYRLRIEEEKEEADNAQREEQSVNQNLDRWISVISRGVELILPLAFYATWMRRGFKFEETGTFTSTTFRGLFNRFKPTKK